MSPTPARKVLACLCFLLLADVSVSALKIETVFAFGDSFLDNGNAFSLTGDPGFPYGKTYPGYSTGTYSDGVNLADTISAYLGIWPPPVPIFTLNANSTLSRSGVNFAIGGAGVLSSFPGPFADVPRQVDYFEEIAKTRFYNMAKSLALTSIGGNDYEIQRKGVLLTKPLMNKIAPLVLNATWVEMNRLYKLGVRNFAILNLQPVQCQPMYVEGSGNGKCLSTSLTNYKIHNEGLKLIQKRLIAKKAKVVILDLYKASLRILSNPKCFRMDQKIILSACCSGRKGQLNTCGQYDEATKKPLFTVCKSPKSSFWWDTDHFGDAASKALSALFFYKRGYTVPGRKTFCNALGLPCPKYKRGSAHPAAIPFSSYCIS